jgi:hypothetical protein
VPKEAERSRKKPKEQERKCFARSRFDNKKVEQRLKSTKVDDLLSSTLLVLPNRKVAKMLRVKEGRREGGAWCGDDTKKRRLSEPEVTSKQGREVYLKCDKG